MPSVEAAIMPDHTDIEVGEPENLQKLEKILKPIKKSVRQDALFYIL
jgi:hypothetical protein